MTARRRTSTSNFGVGGRESHDATGFYRRFTPPEVSSDDTVLTPAPVAEPVVCGDSRSMTTVADGSVALVVTSPPYFAGKQYEEELARDGVPASYLEYLELLHDVFADCVRVLEPGGRIAVNVANLGRKPYRSLSADVIGILESLGLLLRGELIWQKADGANGSCAWGSYRSAANPVLRDVSERVVIASKGRFDRARSVRQRAAEGLPHESTMSSEDFMSLTLDTWSIPPESARRVGHPAPFPVELPEQLIRLYTYVDDLVLDPFMGSGSTLVAAHRLSRRYVGYDLDPAYAALALTRLAETDLSVDAVPTATATQLAEQALLAAGFSVTRREHRVPKTAVTVTFHCHDRTGQAWFVDVAGANLSHRGGLTATDVVWRTLGRASAVHARHPDIPLLLLTTALPRPRSEARTALDAAGDSLFVDVLDVTDPGATSRLATYVNGHRSRLP